ncbi:hypothetical protein BSZ35_08640 [Salinibacter sp. 10B]|uniref:hypothetical protein n=1 Tax=Salinibacter sp. 10B TaxID=1923971 RepID=UPI000CF385D2|nr:hypothetical protein [Salinibacter sp. 10B]PQJ34657.1 hypothetical protein BSZ35_08640 [Salinibacter sp. 10B]
MQADSPDSFRQITDVLTKSLKQAFNEVCPERYGAPLSLRRIEDADTSNCVSFRLEGTDAISLQIHVTISHVGGNVYDIGMQVEEGPVRRFTYSEPDTSGSSLSIAPYLGKKIAERILDEVEQRLGKQVLRTQVVA